MSGFYYHWEAFRYKLLTEGETIIVCEIGKKRERNIMCMFV